MVARVGLCLYQSVIGMLFVVCETVTHLRRCDGTRLVLREISKNKTVWSPISHDWGHHVAGEERPLSRTSKLDFETLLYFSSQPDGSPGYVASVSVSDPGMDLPPVFVDGKIY